MEMEEKIIEIAKKHGLNAQLALEKIKELVITELKINKGAIDAVVYEKLCEIVIEYRDQVEISRLLKNLFFFSNNIDYQYVSRLLIGQIALIGEGSLRKELTPWLRKSLTSLGVTPKEA